RVPVTFRGKVIAVVWMGVAFILVTVASGLVTSALTVQQLQPVITGPNELAKAKVACVRDSDGQRFLQATEIQYEAFATYEQALNALRDDHVEAVVGSTVVLGYLIDRGHSDRLTLLPQRLRTDYVGMAMRYGLPEGLERRFELEMLKVAQSDEFRAYRNAFMGESMGPQR
ncbi:MAG: transporter substrate-binding domain-containing protein, partial [Phycisphaerae bacterium]|nr:transporter substrate-binding domain-containing protein [Phycisphaerae bacterium]